MKITMLSAVAAMLAKPVATEEEAITELTALQPQITTMREFRSVVAAELDGETDPVKVATKIRELKSTVQTAIAAAAEQKKAAIRTTVEATIKQYENTMTVPLKAMFTQNLTAELEKGVEVEKSETLKTIKSLKPLGIFDQSAGPDVGGAGASDEDKIEALSNELLEKDPSLKALAARDWAAAKRDANSRAYRQLKTAST